MVYVALQVLLCPVMKFITTQEPNLSVKNYGFSNLKEAILGINNGWIEINKTKIKIGKSILA